MPNAADNESFDLLNAQGSMQSPISQSSLSDVTKSPHQSGSLGAQSQDHVLEQTAPTSQPAQDLRLPSFQSEPHLDAFFNGPQMTWPFMPFSTLSPGNIPDLCFGNILSPTSLMMPGLEPGAFGAGVPDSTYDMAAEVVLEQNDLVADDEDTLIAEHIPHVPPINDETRSHIILMLKTETSQRELEQLANDFPSLQHLDVYVQLYFEHFHPRWPFLHIPTFEASPRTWLLVFAVANIGCQYSAASQKNKHLGIFQRFANYLIKKDVGIPSERSP
jgi:hypothetical protein